MGDPYIIVGRAGISPRKAWRQGIGNHASTARVAACNNGLHNRVGNRYYNLIGAGASISRYGKGIGHASTGVCSRVKDGRVAEAGGWAPSAGVITQCGRGYRSIQLLAGLPLANADVCTCIDYRKRVYRYHNLGRPGTASIGHSSR